MAENYGSLEGVLDANETLEGEIDSHDEMSGEIQFSGGVGGVKDVRVNNESVVDANKVAHIDLTPYAEKEDVYDKQTIDTALEGKADIDDIPTALSQLDNDANYVQDADYVHTNNNFTDEDKAAIGNIPENVTDLSDVAVDNIQNGQVLKWDATQEKFVNADESGGGGDVTDVKVDGTSVVDPVTGEADIDLTGKADKVLDAVAGDFAVLLANGNCANSGKSANDMASKAEMSVATSGDQTTIQLKSGTSATVINQHQDISGKADKSSLGTAAEKDSTALIVVGSTDLAEAGAVREAIDSAVASSYHHAGTKTCAELVASLLVRANEGNVYNMTDSGVTTADFIEGAGKPIEEGANVGIAKIAENTYKFDLLSGFIDTSNFIEKSVTSGFVKNDGSIDTNTYQQTEAGKGLSTNDYDNTAKGIVDGVTAALADKVDKVAGKGLSTNDYTTTDKNKVATIDNKADKVTNATENNFAALDANGNLKDSGHKHSDYLTQHQDISGKADKVSSATNGNLAGLNGSGNLTDSGWNGAKDTTSISGNPISISGLKANQLAVNPIITLEPIQAGSGTPSPSNIRAISGYDKIEVLSCGVNLLAPTPYSGAYNMAVGSDLKISANIASYTQNSDGITVHVGTAWYCRTFATGILKAGTYKFYVYNGDSNVRATVYLTDENLIIQQNLANIQAGGIYQVNITATQRSRVAISITKNVAGDENCKSLMVFEGTTLPTYEPYHKTTSISESLGQTVYGATWYPRTGELDNSHGIIDMGDMSWERINTGGNNYFRSTIADAKYVGVIGQRNACCSCYGLNSSGTSMPLNKEFAITGGGYSGALYVLVRDDSYSDANVFKTSVTGQTICYELATHGKIQLTPHEISLLKDYAYVSTNGTNISLDYHNGELASLSDVSQLGETLNALGDAYPITLFEVPIAGTTISLYYGEIITNIDVNKYVPISIADGTKWDEKCNYSWGYSNGRIRIRIKCTESTHTIGSDRDPILVYCILRKRVTP